MEGGYVNEGGQLKMKNGHKYVVNKDRSGIFVTKSFGIIGAVIAVLILIFAILITYFLTRTDITCDNRVDTNETVAKAGIFGVGSSLGSSNAVHLLKDNDPAFMKEIKLYDGWNPEMYTLIIEPNLATSTNNGTISIQLKRDLNIKGLRPIILDINNITISDVRVINGKNAEPIPNQNGYGDNNETYFIKLTSKNIDDKDEMDLIIDMVYFSHLTDTLQGVYRSGYENAQTGATEWMFSTQFSPIDARRAFPCIDRPDKKANFTISIVHETDKSMALSNMPSYYQSYYRPGYTKDDFLTTPKMSTYLVAFMVSNLVKSNYTEMDNKSPRIEIWTRPEVTRMTKYAYKLTRQVVPFFEKYFGIPYQFDKIDLVSIPDFGYAAMENWGLITFRDSSILVPANEERTSAASHTEHVATTVAHEVAHQWFGNLVTMKWWDDLWLKEGFASYLSYVAVNAIHPEWQVMESLPITDFRFAMKEDSDQSSHPIFFPVKNTVDVRRIFDSITYSKGNIIVRMVNSFIGDEAFELSVRDFLSKYQYKNADRDDLWEFMTTHGHNMKTLPNEMNVKEIMDSWTHQAGYPVVTLTRINTSISIQQQRFMFPQKDSKDQSKWFIPITYATDEKRPGDDIPVNWITNTQNEIIIPDVFSNPNNSENYIYLNLNRKSYYRVNYDYASWIVLHKRLKELPQITRAQLLDDSLHLARSEFLSYDIPLTFLMEMQSAKDDLLLWSAAEEGITYLIYMLQREPAYESFRAFMRFIVRNAYDLYKLEEPDDNTHLQLMHRSRVVKLACKFNYDRCTNAAQSKYREWMVDPKNNLIRPNLKLTIYCTALQEGSFQEWYFAYKRYQETASASEKEQILTAMGCTAKPWLLSKYLNMTIDSTSGIRKQDGARAFGAVARNPIGYEIAFDFLVTNIEEISVYFGDGFSTLSTMIDSITTYMNKDYQLDQLNLFAEKAQKLGLKSITQSIQLATEKVKNNIFWRSRSYYDLKKFLESFIKDFHINLY